MTLALDKLPTPIVAAWRKRYPRMDLRPMEKREVELADIAIALEQRLAMAVMQYEEAIEDIEHWGAYASQYFQDKHGLDLTLQQHRAFLALLRPEVSER